MLTRIHLNPLVVLALGLLASTQAFAMGQGRGMTKIDFCTSLTDFTDSRLFAKMLVTSNGNVVGVNNPGKGHGHGNKHGHKHGKSRDQGDDQDNRTIRTSRAMPIRTTAVPAAPAIKVSPVRPSR